MEYCEIYQTYGRKSEEEQRKENVMHYCPYCGALDKILKVQFYTGAHDQEGCYKISIRAVNCTWHAWDEMTPAQRQEVRDFVDGQVQRFKHMDYVLKHWYDEPILSCPLCRSTNVQALDVCDQKPWAFIFPRTAKDFRCRNCHHTW